MNLYETLYSNRDPDCAALEVPGAGTYTTADLIVLIGRYASALRACGVKEGDRVSFKLGKAPEVMFLAHACLQLGAILHPLNTAYTDQEIEYLLDDIEPALFVCEPGEHGRFEGLTAQRKIRMETLADGERGTIAALAKKSGPILAVVDVEPDRTAAILYTSGTTGKPKGARITHYNLAQSAQALALVWQLGPTDVLLHALPVYHAHGLLTAINVMLVAGGSILFLPRFEPAEVIAALPAATLMMGVPTHYARLLREPSFMQALSPKFRMAISGSAPLPLELAAEFERCTGRHLIERYGSTEAAIVTALPVGSQERAGWVGWPLPGVQVRVALADGTRASEGATGMLETRGHNVFRGYWKRPDADHESFTADGWFITGDIAQIDDSGCVRLLDRAKDLIISGGLNVYPKEVETVLDTLPGIIQSAVFGVPHPDFGEAVVAEVEVEPGFGFDEASAMAAAKVKLAGYKAPKRIFPVADIARNRLGKVLKSELRVKYRGLFVVPKS